MKIINDTVIEPRKVFASEERDFSPWVANNIHKINEQTGMNLKPIGAEERIGSYEADIIAIDLNTGEYVVIENQLENSDHKHLGQCLTYSSNSSKYLGFDITSVIWICKKFTPEHKCVLETLNAICNGKLNCYGLEIKVYYDQDNDSALVNFNSVVKPNTLENLIDISESVPSELKECQKSFWTQLINKCKEDKVFPFDFGNIKDNALQYLPIKFTNKFGYQIQLGLVNNSKQGTLSIKLEFSLGSFDDNKYRFDKLFNLYELESKNRVHQDIIWNRNDSNKSSNIMVSIPFDVKDDSSYSTKMDEILNITETFYNFFKKSIENL